MASNRTEQLRAIRFPISIGKVADKHHARHAVVLNSENAAHAHINVWARAHVRKIVGVVSLRQDDCCAGNDSKWRGRCCRQDSVLRHKDSTGAEEIGTTVQDVRRGCVQKDSTM